jgi:hypothetical protein
MCIVFINEILNYINVLIYEGSEITQNLSF